MIEILCSNEENVNRNKKEHQELIGKEINELDNFTCTDLYIIGRIWIAALKTCLIGANFNLFPVVEAAKADETPKKPSPMKYTDLSLYKSPHCEFKEYIRDKDKCPDSNVKLLHRFLLPYVKNGRQNVNKLIKDGICMVNCNYRNAREAISKSKNDFKETMRDPENLAVRQGLLAAGGIAGYIIGGGGGIPRRLFFTSAGLLTTGALCFPKETDETFRNATFVAGKTLIALYNKWCGKDFNLRERLACRDELPPPPPIRNPLKCPPPK